MIEQLYDLRPEVLALDRKRPRPLPCAVCPCGRDPRLQPAQNAACLHRLRRRGTAFLGSSGYGVWDDSRNKLEEVFARCMGAEAALVRPQP